MINSIFPIKDRVYFLKKGNSYQQYRYTERGNSCWARRVNKAIPMQTPTYLVQHLFKSLTLPYEKDIWDHAPESIRRALLFSYSYHEHQLNDKVANVETTNWLAIPYFSDLLAEGRKQTAFIRIFPHFRTWFNAMTRTNGNHKKNLRLGHIHFTYDILEGKEVYCIHWDIGASRFSPSLLIHWIFDDMSS